MSGNAQQESPRFRQWTEFVLAHRPAFLVLTAAITGVFAYFIVTQLRVDSSIEYFANADTEAMASLEQYRDDFGRDDLYMVLVEGDVFTTSFLDDLRSLHEALEQVDVEVTSQGERHRDREADLQAAKRGEAPRASAVEEPAKTDPFDDAGFDDGFGTDGDWGDTEGGTIVEEVTSLINARQTVWRGGGIQVRGLLDDRPSEADLPALSKQVLADDFLVGNVVGKRGQHAVLLVRTDFVNEPDSHHINAVISDVANQFDRDGFRTTTTGLPDINATLDHAVMSDMMRLIGVAFLVMNLLIAWIFRHPLNLLGSLGVIGLSSLWTLGLMAYTATPITILSNIIPAFLAAVGMGDSVHIQAVHVQQLREGASNKEAIVRAVGSTGTPVVFTTFTTMAGLLSFQFASSQAIQEMGLFSAFGVVAALIHSIVFLPIVLSWMGERQLAPASEHVPDHIDGFLNRATALSEGPKKWRVLVGAAVLTVTALVGIAQLDVYHNPLVWLGTEHRATVAVDTMDREVGGTASVHILVEAKGEQGLRDLDQLRRLERLESHVRGFVHPTTGDQPVTDTLSLLDIVKETNRALHEGDPAFYRLPDTQRGVSDALLLFENAGPDQLSRLATSDLKRSHMTVRLNWMDASSYLPFRDHLEQGIEQIYGDTADVKATGSVYSLLSVVGTLINDLLTSFAVAFVAITTMMIVLLRNVRLGLISMAPNLMPVLLVFGFMGFVGIDIDLSNLLIASIIIGIAVDDTIHYLHQWRTHHENSGDTEAAIRHALEHAGRALVSTSVILALGFGVYVFSSLISIVRFGLLTALTCFGALLIDIIVTPALIRAVYPGKRSP